MPEFKKVATTSEVPGQSGICVEIEGKRIAVFHVGGEFYAIDDTCTHKGAPLSEGTIEGDQVQCPWHGACFNLKTGAVISPPAPEGVTAYHLRVVGEDVELEL